MEPLITHLRCVQCDTQYAPGDPAVGMQICPACGIDEGLLDVQLDLDVARRTLTRAALATRPLSHWRYRELLPLNPAHLPGTAVGWTPISEAPALAHALGIRRLRLKDEGRNFSGSFKDRPSSLGVARAKQAGAEAIACASTGNAASSTAAAAAAGGLPCFIFVSQRIPAGKLAQLLVYGATVFKILGSYDDAWRLCQRACERFGWYNRNAAVNPWMVEGKKTGGLEIAEQCADDPPEWVSASVGDGCSIAAVAKGLAQMKAIGIINWQARMLGVQARGVAPITAAFGSGELDRSGGGDTYADSINCPVPRNWRKAVTYVRDSGGGYVNVDDDEIRNATRECGRLTGIFAEPAAAAAIAGIAAARRQGLLTASSDVLAIVSGNGLKDIQGALSAVGRAHEIPPDLGEVERVVAALDRGCM